MMNEISSNGVSSGNKFAIAMESISAIDFLALLCGVFGKRTSSDSSMHRAQPAPLMSYTSDFNLMSFS